MLLFAQHPLTSLISPFKHHPHPSAIKLDTLRRCKTKLAGTKDKGSATSTPVYTGIHSHVPDLSSELSVASPSFVVAMQVSSATSTHSTVFEAPIALFAHVKATTSVDELDEKAVQIKVAANVEVAKRSVKIGQTLLVALEDKIGEHTSALKTAPKGKTVKSLISEPAKKQHKSRQRVPGYLRGRGGRGGHGLRHHQGCDSSLRSVSLAHALNSLDLLSPAWNRTLRQLQYASMHPCNPNQGPTPSNPCPHALKHIREGPTSSNPCLHAPKHIKLRTYAVQLMHPKHIKAKTYAVQSSHNDRVALAAPHVRFGSSPAPITGPRTSRPVIEALPPSLAASPPSAALDALSPAVSARPGPASTVRPPSDNRRGQRPSKV
ncbi:hypothetical protein V8E36_008251 [Tilletia maclaganii]